MDSILIVDDERGIRDTLRAVMEDEGFVADTVASGEECLKALGKRAYGCILLDVWLPGIDGLETLRQLRSAGSEAAVVIISGHGNIETAVRATKLGAFDFIEKEASFDCPQRPPSTTTRADERQHGRGGRTRVHDGWGIGRDARVAKTDFRGSAD